MPCPLVEQQETMNVVWHYDNGWELDAREVPGNLIPAFRHQLTDAGKPCLTGSDFSEEKVAIMRTDRHEVVARL
jgi:hypothetical protein